MTSTKIYEPQKISKLRQFGFTIYLLFFLNRSIHPQQFCVSNSMAKIYNNTQLPDQFAEKLLQCEIEVELNEIVSKEIVMRILQLYSKGMEYFESIKSYKYMYFQRKMNSLLRCPKILHSVEKSQPNDHPQITNQSSSQTGQSKDQSKHEKMKAMEIKQKYEKLYNDLVGETSSLTGDKIKKIVAENQVKLSEVKASIKGQISEQEQRLQVKIQRRKFIKENKKCFSAVGLEKSTKDSLFNDSQNDGGESSIIETDFSQVIHENQVDSEGENAEKGVKDRNIIPQNMTEEGSMERRN